MVQARDASMGVVSSSMSCLYVIGNPWLEKAVFGLHIIVMQQPNWKNEQ